MRSTVKLKSSTVLLLAVAGACAGSRSHVGAPPVDPATEASRAAATIDSSSMRAHVAFLASDELAGRDTPSPGLEAAAEYIARRFEAMGLEPAGTDGGWLQRYPYVSTSFDAENSELTARGERGGASLVFGEQWFALPVTPDHEETEGSAVYAGSTDGDGLPEQVRGRIAILTTGPELGAELFSLIRTVAEAGAGALLLVLHPDIPDQAIPTITGQVSGLPAQTIPVVGVTRSAAGELFAAAGLEIDSLAPAEGISAEVREVDLVLSIRIAINRESASPPNVAAILRGSDPELRDTYVLYSAHFDHVGIGTPNAEGDSIYNGADDDASGTALVLGVAGAFAALPEPPRRSILFLAVSGEEKGLLGSRFWAENPTVPIDRVVANLNADMVGRNAPDTVIAIGAEYSSLGALTESIAATRSGLGLVVAPDPDPSENAFFRSDHVAFIREGVPAVFLTTWLHEDYHAPSDEVDGIDADKLARIARLAFWVGWEVAESLEPPTWNPGAWDEVNRILQDSPF